MRTVVAIVLAVSLFTLMAGVLVGPLDTDDPYREDPRP